MWKEKEEEETGREREREELKIKEGGKTREECRCGFGGSGGTITRKPGVIPISRSNQARRVIALILSIICSNN